MDNFLKVSIITDFILSIDQEIMYTSTMLQYILMLLGITQKSKLKLVIVS